MTRDQLQEIAGVRDGHYGVESEGGSIHIYMEGADGRYRMVATRSAPKAALALLRQRREAFSQGDALARRSCRATIDRILAENRPPLQPTGS